MPSRIHQTSQPLFIPLPSKMAPQIGHDPTRRPQMNICGYSRLALCPQILVIRIMEWEDITPTRGRRFWLSDYIYQKRYSEGKKDRHPRLGIARRMPRINKSHQKQFEDTLKMLTKSGEPEPIIISFEDKVRVRNKSTNSNYYTTRNKNSSLSPRDTIRVSPMNKFKKLSGDLIQRIRTQGDLNTINWTPKPPARYNKVQQRAAFQIKASDEWLHAQQQILKINLRHQLLRLQKRRIKKIQLGIDNRSIDELIRELKN